MFRDKKKLLLMFLLLVVIIIIVIIILSFSGNKKIGYDELEEKLISSTKSYYTVNQRLLPKKDGDESSVTIKKLVSEEYIKPLEKLVENGDKCSGEVVVKNVDDNYSYIPYLDCGKNYEAIKLNDKILDENPTVIENLGLYIVNDNYMFRGEVDNNYLKINGTLWRIMGINSDGSIKIIFTDKAERSVYDDRYNSEKKAAYGKNEYEISRLYDNLTTFLDNDDIFTTDLKARLVKINACVAGRSVNEEDNSMNVECSKTLEDQYATLITVSEYINASLDSECKNSDSNECQNYNYLSKFNDNANWWTITPDLDTTYMAYQISTYGTMSLNSCYSLASIRPIVYLSSDILYKGGDGTLDDPYIIFSRDKIISE